jgi:hypothetical protein
MGKPDIVSWFDNHWLDTFDRGVEGGFDSLSERDRVLALVGAAFDHEIGAGRRVLYAGPVGAHTAELADAFEAIGAPQAARVIRQFAATFLGGAPSADEDERVRQVDELPASAWKVLHAFGDLFEECGPDGERMILTKLYEWYHAQTDQASGPKAKGPAKGTKPRTGPTKPRRKR